MQLTLQSEKKKFTTKKQKIYIDLQCGTCSSSSFKVWCAREEEKKKNEKRVAYVTGDICLLALTNNQMAKIAVSAPTLFVLCFLLLLSSSLSF